MAATRGDRKRSTLLAVAFIAIVLAGVSLRSITSARQLAAAPIPVTDIESLAAFLTPLPPSGLAQVGTGTMVVTRDPFAAPAVARETGPAGAPAETRQPKSEEGLPWVVSSIMFEGTKKSAIVNNTWVTVGDPLGGGSRVSEVERDHIVVTDAKGIRHVVPIKGGEL